MAEKALIIGATGGIGSALSKALTARGVDVTGVSRSDGLDLTDAASIERTLGSLDGPFDRIVVATGILAPDGQAPEKTLSAIDAQTMAAVMAVNAIGPALVLSAISNLLPRQARSVIAVLTARVGSIGDNKMGGWYSYRASKAAANQIVHGAAIELGRKYRNAILVALHPGTVATDFTANYPAHKKNTPDEAAESLIRVMDGLSPSQSGGFFDYSGAEIPW
ncbi:MAG: SDR family NAD(P)-dependent oxidoreductase [Pseudomonadota bacterium]